MSVKVFKFGGASVNSAEAVKNATSILQKYSTDKLMVIISAMGKTTNLLENLTDAYFRGENCSSLLEQNKTYHWKIVEKLSEESPSYDLKKILMVFEKLSKKIASVPSTNYQYEYDQVVSFGELISTTIIHAYWECLGIENLLIDAREYIITDLSHCNATVDWTETVKRIRSLDFYTHRIILSQGFIGGDKKGTGTTLGREGSDYSAAIFAYGLDALEMTIWKDVPGLLNADPKYFSETKKLDFISYRDAIELAYYGATIIHPKTIKPLQNKNILLHVKSFVQPDETGSQIGNYTLPAGEMVPCFIFKTNQILITISPKDFSFIAEDNLRAIFAIFAENNIKINLMQNSAISFSICIDLNINNLDKLIELLQVEFNVRYNTGLELITIRHYNTETIDNILQNKNVLLEFRSRYTAQFVVKND